MEKRVARLLNSSKAGNILDLESEGVRDLIEEYFSSSNSQENGVFPLSDSEESDLCSEPVADVVEQPLIEIYEAGDATVDCNGQAIRDLQEAEQFSCYCKQIECEPVPGDQRSGCIVQFSPAEVLAFNLSFKDMGREEKDMLILGLISSAMRNGPTTQCKKRTTQTERQKSRSSYTFNGYAVCTKTFLKLLGISPNKLKNLQDHYKENGLMPRKLKSGGRKSNPKALEEDEYREIKQFILQFAEDHAVHLPGRVPGFKRDDILLLPSSTPKCKVYRHYVESAGAAGHDRIISRATFCKVWLQLCPNIVVARPMTDLCWKCQNNNTRIFRSANLSDEEKSDLLMEQQRHLSAVDAERKHYNDLVSQSKDTVRRHQISNFAQTPPNSRDMEIHYSFDFAQQVHLPSNAAQPGPMYFLTARKVALFGVCCEAFPKQINFIIDEAVNVSKGSQGVISYLHYFFEHFGLGEKRVQLHCDNCSGQNKNNFVLWYFAWRVMMGLHSEVTINFMPAGHTKFAPDWCFGLLKRKFRRCEVSCLDDLCDVVVESTVNSRINVPQLAGREDGTVIVPTYDWQAFLTPAFKRMPGVLQFSHFRLTSERPGILFYKSSLAEEEQSKMIVKSAADFAALPDMPTVLPPPGLPRERQEYLYKHIREYVREDKRDVVCPRPRN